MAAGTALCLAAPALLTGLFAMDAPAQREIAVRAVRIYGLSLLFTGFNTMNIYYFQAQERERNASAIVLLSGTVLPILLLFLLTALAGVDSIWWSYLLAQGLTLLLSALRLLRERHGAGGAIQ